MQHHLFPGSQAYISSPYFAFNNAQLETKHAPHDKYEAEGEDEAPDSSSKKQINLGTNPFMLALSESNEKGNLADHRKTDQAKAANYIPQEEKDQLKDILFEQNREEQPPLKSRFDTRLNSEPFSQILSAHSPDATPPLIGQSRPMSRPGNNLTGVLGPQVSQKNSDYYSLSKLDMQPLYSRSSNVKAHTSSEQPHEKKIIDRKFKKSNTMSPLDFAVKSELRSNNYYLKSNTPSMKGNSAPQVSPQFKENIGLFSNVLHTQPQTSQLKTNAWDADKGAPTQDHATKQ